MLDKFRKLANPVLAAVCLFAPMAALAQAQNQAQKTSDAQQQPKKPAASAKQEDAAKNKSSASQSNGSKPAGSKSSGNSKSSGSKSSGSASSGGKSSASTPSDADKLSDERMSTRDITPPAKVDKSNQAGKQPSGVKSDSSK
jgi:DNA topoisomerase-1